jgi:hypothetical protein
MGVLRSDELKDDSKLEACATAASAHLSIGARPAPGHRTSPTSLSGKLRVPHILKIQLGAGSPRSDIADRAFNESRATLRIALIPSEKLAG